MTEGFRLGKQICGYNPMYHQPHFQDKKYLMLTGLLVLVIDRYEQCRIEILPELHLEDPEDDEKKENINVV